MVINKDIFLWSDKLSRGSFCKVIIPIMSKLARQKPDHPVEKKMEEINIIFPNIKARDLVTGYTLKP